MPGGLLVGGRFVYSTLADNGAGATDSSYTENTPRPGYSVGGDSRNRATIATSGGQANSYEMICADGGMPALDGGASFLYRLTSEATNFDYRGWEPPVVLSWATLFESADVDATDAVAIVTVPSSQRLIIAWADTTLGGGGGGW